MSKAATSAHVWYRLPNESTVFYLESETVDQLSASAIAPDKKGFVAAPFLFTEDASKASFIVGKATPFDSQLHPSIDSIASNSNEKPIAIERENYLEVCRDYVEQIKSGQLEKAILSRIAFAEAKGIQRQALFNELCASYPTAFVYYLQLPNQGNWMGATPETLIKSDKHAFTTMALAGTQKDSGLPLDEVKWGEKERHEQALVTNEIESSLHFPFVKEGPTTVRAGKVLHLQTMLRSDALPAENRAELLWKTTLDLHPTPAVCGLPRKSAFELINTKEQHNRELYTGFLGPVDLKNDTHLFVNLRCMQDFGDSFALYLGGGITAASDPTKEWEETALKAQTLLSVIEKMRKFAT